MALRKYQIDAVNAATAWMRKSVMPGVLELATGSGKSHIISALAAWFYETTGKRVLCLQPSKELCEQNAEKYRQAGGRCSIFSASAGGKCMRHPVVYGTPQTVKNSLSRFGDQFGLVVIDECHGITQTIKLIIDSIRGKNAMLRVLGLSATPFRTQSGYVYQYDENGKFIDETEARDPYFNSLLYRITTRELIDMGFLTPAHADPDHVSSYEGRSLQVNGRGQFDSRDVERVFEGRGRLTYEIVSDIVEHARNRSGVMIFAATVAHAKEIMESLPPSLSRMIGGDINMRKKEREKLVSDFRAQKFKYLVNVATMTTGVDFTHVDLIAIMRATESASLLQQIIGRALRLHPGKQDALILDYAENIERHNLHDDLFTPEIRAKRPSGESCPVPVECPDCGYENMFNLRKEYADSDRDKYGYAIDLSGRHIQTEHGPMPAHYGRRCTGQIQAAGQPGVFIRCAHRWTHKECPECGTDNDIAARYCRECKHELVDPNEKLQREFIRVKKDPYAISTDAVLNWEAYPHTSQAGKEVIRCEYTTEYRTFTVYYSPTARHPAAIMSWESLSRAVFNGHLAPDSKTFFQYLDKGAPPKTITYRKQRDSGLVEAIGHNRPEDRIPQRT